MQRPPGHSYPDLHSHQHQYNNDLSSTSHLLDAANNCLLMKNTAPDLQQYNTNTNSNRGCRQYQKYSLNNHYISGGNLSSTSDRDRQDSVNNFYQGYNSFPCPPGNTAALSPNTDASVASSLAYPPSRDGAQKQLTQAVSI